MRKRWGPGIGVQMKGGIGVPVVVAVEARHAEGGLFDLAIVCLVDIE